MVMKRKNKRKIKRQKWLNKRDYHVFIKRTKRNKNHKKYNSKRKKIKVTLITPENFSLINNTEETMKFFMNFIENVKKEEYGKEFFIDSSNVKKVTVDAIIYLIAIMRNPNTNITMKYRYTGNFPQNEDAQRIFQTSGFTKYVHSNAKKLPSSTENMTIMSGLKNDPEIAKECCLFVMNKLKKTRKDVMPLQGVLIELMSNVYLHAYEKNSFMIKSWFIYAEHIDDYVRIVFVDTGQGIAKTVRKNFYEKIQNIIGVAVKEFAIKDEVLLESVFRGDFRTSTRERHRGNGLKSVKEKITNSIFRKFEVISGKGKCSISSSGKISSRLGYNNTIYGTLFTFEIR